MIETKEIKRAMSERCKGGRYKNEEIWVVTAPGKRPHLAFLFQGSMGKGKG